MFCKIRVLRILSQIRTSEYDLREGLVLRVGRSGDMNSGGHTPKMKRDAQQLISISSCKEGVVLHSGIVHHTLGTFIEYDIILP